MNFNWLTQFFCKAITQQSIQLQRELVLAQDEIELQKQLLSEKVVETEKEIYYNNKYPKADLTYRGRGTLPIDLRDFFNVHDNKVGRVSKTLKGSDDVKALEGLKWVIKNIIYTTDKDPSEWWQFSYETINRKKGDCEDGAILLANILIQAGVPYWKLRLTAGWVQTGTKKTGHAYLTYYCVQSDKWVILDWCYWANTLEIPDRNDYKKESKYKEVWFSWNEKFSYSKGLNDVLPVE